MFKIVIGFTVVGIFLVLVSSVKGETPVKSALELMEKICRNPNLAREAAQSQSIRFGADATGSLFIRFVGSVAAGLGYTAEQKSGEGFRGQLRPEDLTALLKGEQECQKEFKDVLLSTL